jgi:hypothetical protein
MPWIHGLQERLQSRSLTSRPLISSSSPLGKREPASNAIPGPNRDDPFAT